MLLLRTLLSPPTAAATAVVSAQERAAVLGSTVQELTDCCSRRHADRPRRLMYTDQ